MKLCRLGLHNAAVVRRSGDFAIACRDCGRYITPATLWDVRLYEALYVLFFSVIALIIMAMRSK